MKKLMGVALALVMLSGCATKWDVDLNDGYNNAEINGQDRSADIVASQTDAAMKVAKNFKGKTDTENALMAVIAIDRITRIEAPQFHVKAPTLNTDNVKHVAETAQRGIPIIGMVRVSKSAIEAPRSSEIHTANGDIELKDSLNTTITHTNAAGESSVSSYLDQEGSINSKDTTTMEYHQ